MKSRAPSRLAIASAAVALFLAGMAANRLLYEPVEPEPVSSSGTVAEPRPRASSESEPTARTEAGAVDAALEFAAAPQAWLYLGDAALTTAVRDVATDEAADQLTREVAAEVTVVRDALARSAGPVWWIVRPLAWKVESFTADRAQVSVWTVTVLSAADVAMPQSDWFVTAMDLRWQGTAWRLAAVSDTPGPTPQLGGRDEAWEPEPLAETLDGFQRVGAEMPS